MSRIVLVHGIGQQYKGPETLRAEWQPALNDGISLAGGTPLADREVAIAFYGDLFRPRARGLGEPDLDASDVTDPFDEELLLAWWTAAASNDPAVPGPKADTRVRVPYPIQRSLGALGHSRFFTGVVERALISDLRQVRRYFTEPTVRQAVIDRASMCVSSHTRVIVGHSLGSVVAYEALCAHPEWIINIFISLGSPLGHRGLVFDRLSPAPSNNRGVWPGQTRNWVNVADRGDIVATDKYLSSLFGPDVIDLSVHNGSHAHDILPYLTASEVGATIAHGLGNDADDKTLFNLGNITIRKITLSWCFPGRDAIIPVPLQTNRMAADLGLVKSVNAAR